MSISKLEELLALQVPTDVSISPDGKKVLYATSLIAGHKVDEHAKGGIWVAEVGVARSARQMTSGLHNDQSPKWSADGRSIYFLSDRKENGEALSLYSLSLSGGEPVPLLDVKCDASMAAFAVSPKGKHIAFLSPDEKSAERKRREEEKDDPDVFGEKWEFNRLRLLHLETKAVDVLIKGDFHVLDLVWDPDATQVAYTTALTPELESGLVDGVELRIVKVADKKSTLVADLEYRPSPGSSSGLHWVEDRIYGICNSHKDSTSGSEVMMSISLKDGSMIREIGGDTFCATDLKSHDGCVAAKTSNDLYDEIRIPRDNILYRARCAIISFDVHRNSSGSITTALVRSTANNPAEVFTVTAEAKSIPMQVSCHSLSEPSPIMTFIPLHTACTDSKHTVDGFLLAPVSEVPDETAKPSKPLRALVMPHGGPYSRYTSQFWVGYGWPQTLLRNGIAVLCPNYRGGMSHGQSFAGPYQAGKEDYEDVVTMVNHAIERGLVDPNNLILGGWSQGGFLAYLGAVRNGLPPANGWKWRAVIAGAGVSDWDLMVAASDIPCLEGQLGGKTPWTQDNDEVTSRMGSAIWEFKDAAAKGRIPPSLLLHGQDDERVPVSQAWVFQRACRRMDIECHMVTYPREGHLFRERKHWVDMHKRVLQFCELHFS